MTRMTKERLEQIRIRSHRCSCNVCLTEIDLLDELESTQKERDKYKAALDVALDGLDDARSPCVCTFHERLRGHLVECRVPFVIKAIAKVKETLGEKV